MTGFLLFVLFLALSRFGKIRLGRDGEQPEFRTVSWLSMLFAAGVGLSFLFWGVAEPASHFGVPPYGMVEAESTGSAELGMQYTFYHWGLHPWAVYALVALAMAYFGFRRGGGGTLISSVLRPLLGDRVDGPLGKAVDILAIFAVLFGVATALGIGALQLGGGLGYVFGLPESSTVQISIIGVLTAMFLISAATGLSRGILYLSLINMSIAGLLALFVLVVGPTGFLLGTLARSTGDYALGLLPMSFQSTSFSPAEWAENWTLFYWAWWISWAPFVGSFIARISRGRTIREFVAGVLLAPTAVSFIWFAVFGGSAIYQDLFNGASIAQTAQEDLPRALFDTLAALPLGAVTSVLALVLVSIFFVTSGDSATFVLGSMSTGGSEEPATGVKLTWGLVVAAFAAVLLLAGGLDALQTATITAAVPFAGVIICMCVALYRALSEEDTGYTPSERSSGREEVEERFSQESRRS